jgi:hypothetical protein
MTTTAHPMPPPLTTSRTIYELSKEAHDGLHFSPRYALETWVVGANMKSPIVWPLTSVFDYLPDGDAQQKR